MSQSDVKEISRQTGEIKSKRSFNEKDWKWIADFVVAEWDRRKKKRIDRERHWSEVDRQIRMEPSLKFKRLPDGRIDIKKKWMAETELPLQAQALEVLTADARRMMFGGTDWFTAHAKVTDEWLAKVEGDGGIRVLGDEHYIASKINQDNADKICKGFLFHQFRQYDHTARFDIINAESFKYGMGVARGRLERKNVWLTEARGVISKNKRIPTIVPCSIKNVYLEETKPSLHSATVLGPAHIAVDNIKYESLVLAANKGSNDPDDEEGGWMPKNLAKITPDKHGYVILLEMEGDIVVPRKTVRSVTIPGAIITVALGGHENGKTNKEATRHVVRFRFRKSSYSSYLLFPYMYEDADEAYANSPLMKGRTVQATATDATNRFLDAGALKNLPPTGYDRNDPYFAVTGGPHIYPGALWGSNDGVKVHNEVGGDPSAMASAAMEFVNLYYQLTGTQPARVGGPVKSHTTATAAQTQLQQSSARTIDYVESTGEGPLTNWLYMAYDLGKRAYTKNETIELFIKEYGGWIEITKDQLPDCSFEFMGAQGPQAKQQKLQNKVQSLMLAMKVDQLRIQFGAKPRLDLDSALDEILRDGGWDDISGIIAATTPNQPSPPTSGLLGPPQGNSGAAAVALEGLNGIGSGAQG